MSQPDLHGFYLAHRGLRQEFGLLAVATRAVRSAQHRVLLEDQLQLCGSFLQHHHHEEDNWVFPTLRERAPEGIPGIDALEDDHHRINMLLANIRNTETPIEERSAELMELHEFLNEHIDREERDLPPLIQRSIDASEWEHSGRRVMNGIAHGQLPSLFGWLASATPDDQLGDALRILPIGTRLLFRMVWNPAYQRRVQALYG